MKNIKTLFAGTAVAAAIAAGAAAFDTKVNAKKNLHIRIGAGATGNTSITLILKNGSDVVSQSTVALTPAGDGITLNYSAPLGFDRFTVSGTSITGTASAAATQVR